MTTRLTTANGRLADGNGQLANRSGQHTDGNGQHAGAGARRHTDFDGSTLRGALT
jgi:hypothetical protein